MKKGAVIINSSRGAIIKTSALLNGLNSKKISAAALDVIEGEHSIGKTSHPLVEYACEHNNLLITPHIGGATVESVEKTDLFILESYYIEMINNG